jgi:hypothetical protein
VSEVWDRVRAARNDHIEASPLTYDWFILALAFLYAISAVRLDGDHLAIEGTR